MTNETKGKLHKSAPFFSIIVVSFNAGGKLRKTLESIACQTFTDYEVILKDGGSTDGSLSCVTGQFPLETDSAKPAQSEPFSTKQSPEDPVSARVSPEDPASPGLTADFKSKTHLIEGRDHGIYDAMNIAVQETKGDYLYFLNCGDYLYDAEVLRKVHDAIEGYGAIPDNGIISEDVAAGKSVAREDDSKKGEYSTDRTHPAVFYGDVYERKSGQIAAANPHMNDFALYRNVPCHQACFYSRDLFDGRGFDLQYKVRADYEHFLWCHYGAGARMTALPLVIADYEQGGFSETKANREQSAREHKAITAKYMPASRRFLFRLYLIATLQPLREKLAQNPKTAGAYDALKQRLYRKRK